MGSGIVRYLVHVFLLIFFPSLRVIPPTERTVNQTMRKKTRIPVLLSLSPNRKQDLSPNSRECVNLIDRA